MNLFRTTSILSYAFILMIGFNVKAADENTIAKIVKVTRVMMKETPTLLSYDISMLSKMVSKRAMITDDNYIFVLEGNDLYKFGSAIGDDGKYIVTKPLGKMSFEKFAINGNPKLVTPEFLAMASSLANASCPVTLSRAQTKLLENSVLMLTSEDCE